MPGRAGGASSGGMDLNAVRYDGGLPVDGYGPGFFRVGGTAHAGAVIVHEGGVVAWDGRDPAPLVALAASVDVVLMGTGAEIAHAPADLRAAVEGAGMGLETMNSPAACRTYNVLVGEGRRVAAALRPVGGQ